MAEYIEREAFIESQHNIYCVNCDRRKDSKGKFVYFVGDAPCRACGIMDVLDAVEDFPAAAVRPVVRGKWKVSVHKTYYDVSCSVCGINSFFQVDEKDSVSYANYCPNCGADMRPHPPKEE